MRFILGAKKQTYPAALTMLKNMLQKMARFCIKLISRSFFDRLKPKHALNSLFYFFLTIKGWYPLHNSYGHL